MNKICIATIIYPGTICIRRQHTNKYYHDVNPVWAQKFARLLTKAINYDNADVSLTHNAYSVFLRSPVTIPSREL